MLANNMQAFAETLSGIKSDYKLMAEYWKQGFNDPQLPQLYDRLIRRTYVLTANMTGSMERKKSTFMQTLYSTARNENRNRTPDSVRTELEMHVSNVAMLSLQHDAGSKKQMQAELYGSHQRMMHTLFDYIVTADQWNERLAGDITDMLTAPTIDTVDQQLMVSAITLACLQTFDPTKFNVLMDTYSSSDDEHVRQRALVGWALCAVDNVAQLFPELAEKVRKACADEHCRQQIAELQMQMVYCSEADADTNKIKNEIMPGLMKGSNLTVTRQGLVEMDEDKLEEILHPDVSERNMQQMEDSMRQMADMQRNGADIYFGGFSQMKRFTFFNYMSNWFAPFYPEHPQVSEIWSQSRGHKLLQTITGIGAFCDSDKYSFVLAFNQVLNHLPKSLLEMVDHGEASPIPVGGEVALEDQQQPTFIRRMYLQNLYRFYRLFPERKEFKPLWTDDGGWSAPFLASAVYHTPEMFPQLKQVAAFMIKHHRNAQAAAMLDSIPSDYHDVTFYLMQATAHADGDFYAKALALDPDNVRALSGYARAVYNSGNYNDAVQAYSTLHSRNPENKGYALNLAVCLTTANRGEEALPLLYKLNYQYPDDRNVSRALAWTETLTGKYDQALRRYEALLTAKETDVPSDVLNEGLCCWLAGKRAEAADHFRHYLSLFPANGDAPDLSEEFFGSEYHHLHQRGISDTDILLMIDEVKEVAA